MKKYTRPQFYGAEILSALVFLCSISAAFMYTLCRRAVFPTTCIMTALSFGIYILFYALRKKRTISFLAFVACLLASILLFSSFSKISAISPVDFLFKASEFYDDFMAAAFISIFSFIIGFPTAYFSVYLPRPAFLLLPAFIPLLLAAKTANGLPPEYVVFIAVGYTLAILGVSRPEYPKETTYFDDKKSRFERLGSLGIFAVIVAVTIYVVPRSDETPLGNYLDTVFQQRSTFYSGTGLSNFTNNSGVNHGANRPSEDILFYVSENSPTILSRWSFDNYNDDGHWSAHPDYSTGRSKWTDDKKILSTGALSSKLCKAGANGYLSEYAPLLKKLRPISQSRYYSAQTMSVYIADNSNTKVIIHPNMTVNAKIRGYNGKIFRTAMDELFAERNFGRNAIYSLDFYNNTPDLGLIDLFATVDMETLLSQAEEEGVILPEEKDAFIAQRNEALEYHEKALETPISSDIIRLASQITEGLGSDYEKALAIERWFGEAGFVYDLDFVPQETTAEYFLFKSRRGICTDFATAATLLMRAADIPTRYAEGFLVKQENKTQNGTYAVKAANAHAFAMGYIEGYGWLEIDGTKYAALAEEVDGKNAIVSLLLFILAIILAIAAFIFRNEISELVFALSLNFKNDRQKIRAIYLRTRKAACKIAEKDPKTTTCAEVCEIISNSLSLKSQAEEITSCADALFYNNTVLPCSKQLYADYREIVKMRKKMRK